MLLVSKGLGLGGSLYANVRAATSDIAQGARTLHTIRPPGFSIPLHAPPPQGLGATSAASHAGRSSSATTTSNLTGRFLQTARSALSSFVSHLTTPGISRQVASQSEVAWGRGLSARVNATVRPPTIAQNLSPATRTFLAARMGTNPLSPAYMSKPPGWSVTQLGLGTARNFSSATRPLFQHLAENVPVALRALNEADVDIGRRMSKDKTGRRFREKVNLTNAEKENAGREKVMKLNTRLPKLEQNDVERYFPSPALAAPGVTTVLLIPLAPTPTSRVPLSDLHVATEPRLLSVPDAQDIINSHRIQSLRVSSLFARLDAKHVWNNGASVTSHGDARGLCTLLRVEFEGWTADMVRGVMGDAGQGWCRLVEVFHEPPEPGSRSISRSPRSPARTFSPECDPAASLVLPALDFPPSPQSPSKQIDMESIDWSDSDVALQSEIGELLTDCDALSEDSEANSWSSWEISDTH